MSPIIDFLQHYNAKQEQQIEQLFKKANSHSERLNLLVENKHLQPSDRTLFLAFLAYLEQQQIEAKQLFIDVIKLPKHQFEQRYKMNWAQVVSLSITFFSIIHETDRQAYDQFMQATYK